MKVYKVHFSCWKVDSKGLKSEENFGLFSGKKNLQVSSKKFIPISLTLNFFSSFSLNLSLDF